MRRMFAVALLFTSGVQAQEIETYVYGQALDIARVVSIRTQAAAGCVPVEAVLTYVDRQGQERQLAYRKLSEGCDVPG